ncbi:MAG: hypothetical protein VX986_06625 [Pseudomonadota bacterium]|nr:hypothetical protein [Pseudomonadota bacterium]
MSPINLNVFVSNNKVFICILASFSGTLLPSKKAVSDVIFDKMEVSIYQTILHEGRVSSTNEILIHENSTGNALANTDQKEIEQLLKELGAPLETVNDWEKKNKRQVPITSSLDLKIKYRILSSAEFENIFNTKTPSMSWDNLTSRYGDTDGFVRLSKPGFDLNNLNSLVLLEHHCGAACGTGRFLHLRRNKADDWVIANSLLLWMAY